MSKLRFRVVESAFKKRAAEVTAPTERPSVYFAKNVFNREKMFKYLPEKAYARLVDSIDNGTPLDRETADAVAAGMKKWAIEMGATHYTHWFHPLTEGTAEKHDAFVEHDGKGGMMEEFAGKLLIQQLPERRYPQHLRSPRLLGLGSFVTGLYRWRHLMYPDDLYRLYR